jgi:SAM-dependent methyltransferase
MHTLLRASAQLGWRKAARQLLSSELYSYVASPTRAAFQTVLPIPKGGTLLDVGAGLGGIATELAHRYHVVALEGVRERTDFIAIRKLQDQLGTLTIWNADLNSIRLAPSQFDGVIVNGVLEWVGLFDKSMPPQDVQAQFMDRLRELLRPNGKIYLAIEGRFGWSQLAGLPDHSGLSYTSLMPRWLARIVCRYSSAYRSNSNDGYRTYTYSYYGYRKLFQRAGLRLSATYVCTLGYNDPTDLVALKTSALREWARRDSLHSTLAGKVRAGLKQILAQEWVWRVFGGDFIFILESDTSQP